MGSEIIIQTNNLSVYYGAQRGIKDLNLSVRKGEVFGFLGPNGAGITAPNRMMLRLFKPDAGTVQLFGGELDYGKLPLPLRLVIKAMKRAEGDVRDWEAIGAWARELRPKLLG